MKPTTYNLQSIIYAKRGFTMVEIIIYVSIVVLLSGILWVGLSNYRKNQALLTTTEIVLSALSEAREKTISSEYDSQYGVYFDQNRAVIFTGTVFSESSSNREFKFDSLVTVASTSLQVSTSTIVFSKVTGEAVNYGTVAISLRADSSKTKTISVSKTGKVSQQ